MKNIYQKHFLYKKIKNIVNEVLEERKCELINEFIQNGFSFNELNNITNPTERFEYCYDFLGQPIGDGSSRSVFEIDDAQVLKIANKKYFDAGCAQNKQEWDLVKSYNSPLLTKVLYHANDFSWIISERVLPSEEIDFYKILGLPYRTYDTERNVENKYDKEHKDLLNYNDYKVDKINNNDSGISYNQIRLVMRLMLKGKDVSKDFPKEYNIINNHPWFKELYNLCENHSLDIDDLGLPNFGIVSRNGKPYIVILDSGLTEEIYNKFY